MKIFIKSCGLIINTDFVVSCMPERWNEKKVQVKVVMTSGEVFNLMVKDSEAASSIFSAIMNGSKNTEITEDVEFGYGSKKVRLSTI
jgi:hypothetical protein